jgi:integrase
MARVYEGVREDKKRGTWTARWRVAPGSDGMRTKRGFASQIEARDYRAKAVGAIANGEGIDPRNSAVLIGTLAEEWLGNRDADPQTAPATFRAYRSAWTSGLRATFGDMPVGKLRAPHIERWQSEQLNDGVSARTVLQRRKVLSTVIAYGMKLDVVGRNYATAAEHPYPNVERLSKQPRPNGDAIGAILDAFEAHAPRYAILPRLCLAMGTRIGEARGLSLDDVTPTVEGGALIQIWQQSGRDGLVATKGNRGRSKPRIVPVGPEVVALINAHDAQYGTATVGRLIASDDRGKAVTTSRWQKLWYAVLDAAAIELPKGVGVHMLRHAFASFALDAGVPLSEVAEMMGDHPSTVEAFYRHATTRTTGASDAALSAIARTPRARHGLRAVN